MPRFIVTTHHEVEANDRTHAALLVYRQLSIEPTPLQYSVIDASATKLTVKLNLVEAETFIYHGTATPDLKSQHRPGE